MLELTWELDSVDVISLSSYTDTNSSRYTDVDISPEYIFDAFRPETMEVFTQEIRVTSTHEGPLQWIAGGFYSSYDETMDSVQIFFDTRFVGDDITGPLGCLVGSPCTGVWAGEIITLDMEDDSFENPFEVRNRDKSHLGGFVNFTYSWEAWEASVGLRVDQWKIEYDNLDSGVSDKTDDVEILPRFSLSRYINEDHMVYFIVAEGYEPGGFNATGFAGDDGLNSFGPERATSYEIGWKGKSQDGRFIASVAAFYIDYEHRLIEFQADDNGTLVEGIFNAGDSEQYGIEVEAQFHVNDSLTLSGSFGWVDAEWVNGTVVVDPDLQDVDLSGDTPPAVQDVNWHLGADFLHPIGDSGLNFIAGVQVDHSGDFKTLQVWEAEENPSYTLVNAQVGVAGERWELTVNAKNLFDEDHYVDLQTFPNLYNPFPGPAGSPTNNGPGSIMIGTLGQPRLITGNFTYRF
jgi:iron complex outermembrane receptor protein